MSFTADAIDGGVSLKTDNANEGSVISEKSDEERSSETKYLFSSIP